MTERQIRKAIAKVLAGFSAELRGVRVVLFGSRARGTARPRSDYDLGLLGSGRLDARLLFDIRDALERLPTLARFDVVDLGRSDEQFRSRVLEHAEVIFHA
ncbi:MAG: nucleotidyltransferase domain-containing protein [Deltaproteobacteria bacterium]|nr:MAG: nucleotidyltransferase domain-containing protein [Deltaproteobacteria bacterium]